MSNEPTPLEEPTAAGDWPAPAGSGASGWLPPPSAPPSVTGGALPPWGPYAQGAQPVTSAFQAGGSQPGRVPPFDTAEPPQSHTLAPSTPQAKPAASGSIERYRAPRRTRQWILLALATLAVMGVVAGLVLRPQTPSAPTTPTARPSATTAPPSAPGQPFTMPSDPQSTGTWQILERQWTADGLVMRVRVTALTGTCSYGFIAFAQGASSVSRPELGTQTPALTTGMLSAGESAEGFVVFDIPRGDTTVILTTLLGRQISALAVKA